MIRKGIIFLIALLIGHEAAWSFTRTIVSVRTIDIHCVLHVRVADDFRERARGLMGVDEEEIGDGMLFVFTKPIITKFWMENTPTSLDVYFFDSAGKLVSAFEDRVPNSRQLFGPDKPIRYVLETKANAFVHPILSFKFENQQNVPNCP